MIEAETLPDIIGHEVLFPDVFETGFYPSHAPPGRYTQGQINAALAGLAPLQIGILSSVSEHRYAGEALISTRLEVDPNGALHGVDFTGDPFDHETWIVPGPLDLSVELRRQSTRRRFSRDVITREYVRKPRTNSSATVDVSVWSRTTPTDLVETAAPLLKYSPATVPAFIPADLVQEALAGAAPGQEVPLASGYGVLPLGNGEGDTVETVQAYNIQYGVDYIGDPDDYLTWIAIGNESVQVSAFQVSEAGPLFLDQTTSYVLVAPDSSGQVLLNPQIAVVTEATDTARTWDKVYFNSGAVPPEVDPGDAAALAAKIQPGAAGLALHTIVETPGLTTRSSQQSIDAHGAAAGVDYSGNPSNPSTWNALTAADVIVDRLATTTLTTAASATHKIHTLYREASADPAQTGQLHLVENNVVGRDVVRVTRRYLNRALEMNEIPEGMTARGIQGALAWANPGETIVAGQTRVRTLVATESSPLADIIDTNGWTLGVDYLGNPADMNTWHAAGPADVYIDIYHPVTRTRHYEEVVTNHLVTAPAAPSAIPPELAALWSEPGPPRAMHVAWAPPYGMEFGIEISNDLSGFVPVPGRYKADGRLLRHSGYFPPSQRAGFLRVKRVEMSAVGG